MLLRWGERIMLLRWNAHVRWDAPQLSLSLVCSGPFILIIALATYCI